MVVGVGTTHADELVPRDAELLGIATHVLAKQTLVEVVVTSGYGGVNGIQAAGTYQLQSLVEVQAVLLDVVAQALQVAEGSVTLVAVVDILLDAQLLQQQHTADTQQDFLLQTVLPVATIEGVGDGFVKVGVHLVVGIQQIELDTADVDTPHVGMHLIVGIGDVDDHRVAVLVELALNGQRTEVLRLVVGNLLSVHAQRLGEVAEAIEETDGAHVDVRVGSLLHVVTGEHTQTAAVDLQGRVDTILHAEVSHRGTLVVGLHIHVGTELGVHVLHALHQRLVLQDLLLAVKGQTLQQHHGIMFHIMVNLRVKVTEQVACLEVPYPPHIVGNLVQTLQLLGKTRLHNQILPLRSICIVSFNFHNLSKM